MNMNLSAKVGVHTGGPVIAGVIGTDKLSFDIFGDAVAIAAKLENSGSNGKVHVSEDTYNLVSYSGNFRVESLENTNVKGQSMIKSYFISFDDATQ